MKPKIYLSGPYTLGDVAVNVKEHMDMFEWLTENGFIVFAPLWCHFQHIAHPRPYEFWIEYTLAWVDACDAVYRMPGESSGADGEVKYAQENNIPVFFNLRALNEYFDEIKNSEDE